MVEEVEEDGVGREGFPGGNNLFCFLDKMLFLISIFKCLG